MAAAIVDTDWIIHSLNGRADVISAQEGFADRGLAVSIVSLAELYEGVYYSKDPAEQELGVDNFLRGVEILLLDREVTRIFGCERGRLRRLHRMIPDMDLLIGATALRHNLTLLSNNRRHFAQIENLRILSV